MIIIIIIIIEPSAQVIPKSDEREVRDRFQITSTITS